MLIGAARIDRVSDTARVDPLDDGIVDVEDEAVDVDDQSPAEEAGTATEFIVDAVLRLEWRTDDTVTLLKLLNGRCGESAACTGVNRKIRNDLLQQRDPWSDLVGKTDLAGRGGGGVVGG